MGGTQSLDYHDVDASVPRGLNYQVAMSNRIFSDNVTMSDLPCMNCLRVEMGERACYNGICDSCGKTPPCLRWMFPELQATRGRRRGSADRHSGPGEARSQARRRNSLASGLSRNRLELSTFTHSYKKVVGIDSEGSEKDSTSCVICMTDFKAGEKVRRLACMHLFHVDCIDHWLTRQRVCPYCRVDVEASAAQFR